ncbi:MAG: transcription termination factor Rho [Chloroflexota bacterium]|nr:transcription termination factor Rho [Chloroflexota bacterium]
MSFDIPENPRQPESDEATTTAESPTGTMVLEPVQEQPRAERRQHRPNPRRNDNRNEGRNGDQQDGRPRQDGRQFRDNRRRQSSDTDSGATPRVGLVELQTKNVEELQALARELEVTVPGKLRKQELVQFLLQTQVEQAGYMLRRGVLDIIEDGFGFLRQSRYLPASDDVYVSQSQIRRFGLRTGDHVIGQVRVPKESEKYHSLLRVEAVNGVDPEVAKQRPHFDKLTPIFPNEQLLLETEPKRIETRLIDLVAPIGRGQRGLVVSPPKAGKTSLLKSIAKGVKANYEDVHLMVLLIGERPEEVTDIRQSVDGEVVASTFDEPVEDHTKVAEMALERGKRLVESGKDVVILMDSVTRLARAYNLVVPASGRTLSGGIDPVALYPPKRFFGAARNLAEGGSLTIIATCLVDTGSRMDDVIYEEFKGTGNMELHLDRKLQERRVFPAIDIQRSSTRREELLLEPDVLKQVWMMRRMVGMLGGTEGIELLLQRLTKTESNVEFLNTLNKEPV